MSKSLRVHVKDLSVTQENNDKSDGRKKNAPTFYEIGFVYYILILTKKKGKYHRM